MIMANEWKARLDRPVTVPFLHVGLALDNEYQDTVQT